MPLLRSFEYQFSQGIYRIKNQHIKHAFIQKRIQISVSNMNLKDNELTNKMNFILKEVLDISV